MCTQRCRRTRWDKLGHDRSIRRHLEDTHAGADIGDYKPYLPAALHDEFDAWAKSYISPFDDLIIATANRNWDSDLRLADMDADGVAAEVLLPNTVPPFFPTTPNITISLPRTRDEFEKRWAECKRTTAGRSTSARWLRPVDVD